jgi:hypothetical protein
MPGIDARLPARSFAGSTWNNRRIASTFVVIE